MKFTSVKFQYSDIKTMC